MRYVVAMVFAVIGIGLAAVYASEPVANWVVGQLSFNSPDDADALHMLVYVGGMVVGLLVGWTVGWTVGGLRTAAR